VENIFSANEQQPEVDPSFAAQAPTHRPTAPRCDTSMPQPAPVELRMPDFEDLARRSAPGMATSAELTYRWR